MTPLSAGFYIGFGSIMFSAGWLIGQLWSYRALDVASRGEVPRETGDDGTCGGGSIALEAYIMPAAVDGGLACQRQIADVRRAELAVGAGDASAGLQADAMRFAVMLALNGVDIVRLCNVQLKSTGATDQSLTPERRDVVICVIDGARDQIVYAPNVS